MEDLSAPLWDLQFAADPASSGRAPIRWRHYRFDPEGAGGVPEREGVEAEFAQALLVPLARPRSLRRGGELLLVLRGVNLNPGADPEDMISVRLLVEEQRILTFSPVGRRMLAVQDICRELEEGRGPASAGAFVLSLCDHLIERMRPVVDDMDDRIGALQEQLLASVNSAAFEKVLADLRREAVVIRRHLAPQRDALKTLHRDPPPWMLPDECAQLLEVVDRTTRFVEELDAVRDQAAILAEQHANQIAARLNNNLYLLTVVSAIFLPLSLLTGMLGMNVGGIPAADTEFGFAVVCGLMLALTVVELWLLRRIGVIGRR